MVKICVVVTWIMIGAPVVAQTPTQWSQATSSGPGPRGAHAMAYDSTRDVTVLFGGRDSNGYFGDTWEWRIVTTSANVFGAGCGGLGLAPDVIAPPVLGATGRALVSNMPAGLAFVAIGWSSTSIGGFALPLDLGGYGMPGCNLLTSAESAFGALTVTGSSGVYSLPLPQIPALAGVSLYLQAHAYSPSYNQANMKVSNGLHWTMGYQGLR